MNGYFLSKAKKTGFSGKSRDAYIAFVSFLVVSAVVLAIGVTLALLGISEAQMGLSEERGHYALSVAEGCAEDALLAIYYDGGYGGGTKGYPEGSCTVSVSKDNSNWTITTAATASGHTKKIQVRMVRSKDITITSWKEVE